MYLESRCLIWILSRLQDSDDTMTDDGKLPLVWQINLAEQQLCEPERLQLIHEYIGLLKAPLHPEAIRFFQLKLH